MISLPLFDRMTHDEVEYYVFADYDCVVQCSIQEFVRRAAAQRAIV